MKAVQVPTNGINSMAQPSTVCRALPLGSRTTSQMKLLMIACILTFNFETRCCRLYPALEAFVVPLLDQNVTWFAPVLAVFMEASGTLIKSQFDISLGT